MKIEWKDCFKIVVSIFCLYLLINYYPFVHDIFIGFISASMPLIIGAVIAYLVNILMSFYEKYLPIKKYRNAINMLLSFLTLFLIIALVVLIVVSEFVSCIVLVINELPEAIEELVENLNENHILSEELSKLLSGLNWEKGINELINLFKTGISGVFDVALKAVTSIFSGVVTALIALIFSVYLLSNKDNLKRQFKKLLEHYLSKRVYENIYYVLEVMNDCFHRYIVGQCLEACILGTLCMLGMTIMSLPYATMIGALIALTALIPVAGAYIGAFVGAFMIMTISPVKALIFLVFLVVLQQFEGNLIYPRVVGSSMGLPGLWVLFAVTIGGGMMGIMGMLISVPLFACVYRIIKNDINGVHKF